jgi:hypothetical protein
MRRFSTSAHDSRDTILSAEVDLGRNTFDFALESKESPLPGANATFIPRPTRLVAVSRTSTRMAKIPTAGREYGRDAGEPAPRFRAFWNDNASGLRFASLFSLGDAREQVTV